MMYAQDEIYLIYHNLVLKELINSFVTDFLLLASVEPK